MLSEYSTTPPNFYRCLRTCEKGDSSPQTKRRRTSTGRILTKLIVLYLLYCDIVKVRFGIFVVIEDRVTEPRRSVTHTSC